MPSAGNAPGGGRSLAIWRGGGARKRRVGSKKRPEREDGGGGVVSPGQQRRGASWLCPKFVRLARSLSPRRAERGKSIWSAVNRTRSIRARSLALTTGSSAVRHRAPLESHSNWLLMDVVDRKHGQRSSFVRASSRCPRSFLRS